jgi:hypothetical protein
MVPLGNDIRGISFMYGESVVTTNGIFMEALEATDIGYVRIDVGCDMAVLTDTGIVSAAAADLSLRCTVEGNNIEIGVTDAGATFELSEGDFTEVVTPSARKLLDTDGSAL